LAKTADHNPEALLSILDASERLLAGRYLFAADSRAFIISHAMQRLEIARHLRCDPSELRFGKSDKRRPILVSDGADKLRFSASRRRSLVVFALSAQASLGVDVENVAAIENPESLLKPFVDPLTISLLDGLSGRPLHVRFAQLWTITEACAKARGTGLGSFTPRLSVRFESATEAVVRDGAAHWRCQLFAPDPAHQIAVAYNDDTSADVKVNDWRPT